MTNLRWVSFTLPLLSLVAGLNAATIIEMQDDRKQVQRFYIGETMARWDTDESGGYMLIEMNGSKVYNVDPRDRTISIVDTGEFAGKAPKSTQSGKMTRIGVGPEIAGYATEKYSLSAADMHCADVFISKSALEVPGVRKMWQVMEDMAESAAGMVSGLAPPPKDPCEAADTSIMGEMASMGMPMRSVGGSGKIESEIVKISQNEKMPSSFFKLPEGYQKHDMNAQMHMIEEMNSQLPSPERMMDMTDEERQQMIIDIMGK